MENHKRLIVWLLLSTFGVVVTFIIAWIIENEQSSPAQVWRKQLSHGKSPAPDASLPAEPLPAKSLSAESLPAELPTVVDDSEPAEQPVTAGEVITGKVIKIVDGDTLDILDSEMITIRVRLEGIATPERGQPFSAKARDKLAELTLSKSIQVQSIGDDRYGRTLGKITADGIDVNLELVRSGFAWHYKQHSDEQALSDAENEARAAEIGLWSPDAETPVAPWDWRKLSKEEREKLR